MNNLPAYANKTDAELHYIIRDASEAARAMQGHDTAAEAKYLDQVNDACTILAARLRREIAPGARLVIEPDARGNSRGAENGKWIVRDRMNGNVVRRAKSRGEAEAMAHDFTVALTKSALRRNAKANGEGR